VDNKSNSPVHIRFLAKTLDIRNFFQNIRSDVKTSDVQHLAQSLGSSGACTPF